MSATAGRANGADCGGAAARSTRTGARRTTSRSARSTCSTTRCSASRCAAEHVKPRLLGHFGTTPGLNLVYAHLNRAIRAARPRRDLRHGPGPRRPGRRRERLPRGHVRGALPRDLGAGRGRAAAAVPPVLVPGRHPEPRRARDAGLDPRGRRARLRARARVRRRLRQPGPPRRLRRRRRRGRDRAARHELALEQVPEPAHGRRRPADPAPERLQDREPDRARPDPRGGARARSCEGTATSRSSSPAASTTRTPSSVHQRFAAALDEALDRIAAHPARGARGGRRPSAPRWPMIVLRTPKGWTGPREVDGVPVEGTWRSHQVPLAGDARRTPSIARSSRSGCAATGPRSSSTTTARLVPELAALPPSGERRMSANPHANGGVLLRDLVLPDFRDYAVEVPEPAKSDGRGDARARRLPARRHRAEPRDLPALRPRRDGVEPARRRASRSPTAPGSPRSEPTDEDLSPRRPRDGGPLRAPLPGLARGLPAHRPARALQLLRGVHPHRRLDVQPAREVAEGDARRSRGGGRSRRSTTCSARTSGARTTTASRTRTRASSTTS